MKRSLTITTALLFAALQAAPVPAGDLSQLAAAAGLTQTEAAGMSLAEVHARKINRENGSDGQVTVSSREHPGSAGANSQLVRSAGLSPARAAGMSLTEVAAYKASRNAGHDDRIAVISVRPAGFDPEAYPQLLAAAGLTAGEASGMSLNDVYRHKINREARGDDRQGTAD